jgi:hypothetical protein
MKQAGDPGQKVKADSYNVAFRYTEKTGGYQGVITWCSFPSEEEFNKWYTPEVRANREVVEKGVTRERAIELGLSTPLECWLAAAREAAIGPNGEVNKYRLDHELEKVFFAENLALEHRAEQSRN